MNVGYDFIVGIIIAFLFCLLCKLFTGKWVTIYHFFALIASSLGLLIYSELIYSALFLPEFKALGEKNLSMIVIGGLAMMFISLKAVYSVYNSYKSIKSERFSLK